MVSRLTSSREVEEEKKEARRKYKTEWARKNRAKKSVKSGLKNEGAVLKFPSDLEDEMVLKLVQDMDGRLEKLEARADDFQKRIEENLEENLKKQAKFLEKSIAVFSQKMESISRLSVDSQTSVDSQEQVDSQTSVDNQAPVDRKNLFMGVCILFFVLLSTYLQYGVYLSRGYEHWLSMAFAACGELAIVSVAYFLESAKTRKHKEFLTSILLAGVLIISLTVANGAVEKMDKLRTASLSKYQELSTELSTKYEKELSAYLSTKKRQDSALKEHEQKLKVSTDLVDSRKNTRDKYQGKDFSAADRRKADEYLTIAENNLLKVMSEKPVFEDNIIKPVKPQLVSWTDPVNQLSVWLQVSMQLFIFLSGIGLTICLSKGVGRQL